MNTLELIEPIETIEELESRTAPSEDGGETVLPL